MKNDIFEQLSMAGLVPVIKVEDANDAVPLCRALLDGGLPVAEITFRTAAAEQAIRNVHEALPEVMLGAGTVLTIDQVKRAVDAGATYIVSPGLNPTVVGYCVENGIPILPGCANPSDIEVALGFGLKVVKFFPAEAVGGLKAIKAMSAPYGGISFVPTGGISEKNVLDYLAFSRIKACGGSWMVPSDAIAAKDWGRITALTRSAVDLILGLRLDHVGVNGKDDADALRLAKQFALLLNMPLRDEGSKSVWTGNAVEVMCGTGAGTHGHIAVACHNLQRAVWHLKRRGFEFVSDEVPAGAKALYFKDEIGGFAMHLVER